MEEICDKLTDIILGLAIGWILVLCVVGLKQWIQRKSLFKVDKWLFIMGLIMISMGVVYVLFDKVFILGYSPKDPTKPSFPSSHTMVAWTICLTAMVALENLIKDKTWRAIAVISMLVMMMIVAVGRVISGEHSVIDVVAGAGIAVVFALIYWFIMKLVKNKEQEKENE